MRVLLSLLSAGYYKNFESVIAELGGRGHEVDVLVHGPTGLAGAEELGARLERDLATVSTNYRPVARDGWQELSIGLRSCEDYLQFLDPRYHEAYRLRATVRVPRELEILVKNHLARSRPGRRALRWALRTGEAALPVSPPVRSFIEERQPDVALFSPYIGLSTTQPAYLHAARAAGIPVAVCVASWDHLSSKSRMHPVPDLVTVWNATQRREATEIHAIPPERIAVTGAQLFDQWFDWKPSSRTELCAAAGLDPDRPFLLYTCFSPFKDGASEAEYVREWVSHVRSSADERLATAGLLIRPHPKRLSQWRDFDLSGFENVSVWPRDGRFVVDHESKAAFFNSLYHSAGVVGLNTSAMIEAAIVGRRVHTILVPRFWESQEGTLHFRYLLEVGGGIVRVARSQKENLEQLSETLARGQNASDENRRFLEEFVRPRGVDSRATPLFVDAVERLGATKLRSPLRRRLDPLTAAVLAPAERRVRAARDDRKERGRAKHARAAQRSATSAPRGATILFQMPYPGYLRMYGSTIRELSDRGHVVLLTYDSHKRRDPTVSEIEALPGVEVMKPMPHREGLAGPVRALRLAIDYLRYLDPRFAGAEPLRRRMDKYLPMHLKLLKRAPILPGPAIRRALRLLRRLELAVPPAPEVTSRMRALKPNCVVVTPLVGRGPSSSYQTDTVRSARALHIPVAVAVSSWDHLTSKGLIKDRPNRIFLWNEAQRREAIKLHDIDKKRIVITGAQAFDHWFEKRPSTTPAKFRSRLDLPKAGPLLLYVGSSPNITPVEREVRFVRRWIEALRTSGNPRLAQAAILIRPHPGNVAVWARTALPDVGPVAVAPRERPNIPMSEEDEALYFDSFHHSDAVVGINTSAMIEAACAGCIVHTVRNEGFSDTQEGTLHFRLLMPEDGAGVRSASGMAEHLDQLAEALERPDEARDAARRFVGAFVRPHGIDRPATPIVVDAIERLAKWRGQHSGAAAERRTVVSHHSGRRPAPPPGPGTGQRVRAREGVRDQRRP